MAKFRKITPQEIAENELLLECTMCKSTLPSSGAMIYDNFITKLQEVYCASCANDMQEGEEHMNKRR